MRDFAQKGHPYTKQIITSGDWENLEHSGKLKPKDFGTIHCYFCDIIVVTIEADVREVELPYCSRCGVYYEPHWIFQDGHLAIQILPRLYSDEYQETNAITQIPQNENLESKEVDASTNKVPTGVDVQPEAEALEADAADAPEQERDNVELRAKAKRLLKNNSYEKVAEKLGVSKGRIQYVLSKKPSQLRKSKSK